MPAPHTTPSTPHRTAQDAWSVLADLHSAWPAYQAAVADMQAAEAEAAAAAAAGGGKKPAAAPAGKGGAAPAPPDADAGLPGPSKHALDAALRVLCVLATHAPPDNGAPGLTGAAVRWLAGAPAPGLKPLVCALGHHSPRVQHRAAQLVAVLVGLGGAPVAELLVAAEAVPALAQRVGGGASASVRLAAVQVS